MLAHVVLEVFDVRASATPIGPPLVVGATLTEHTGESYIYARGKWVSAQPLAQWEIALLAARLDEAALDHAVPQLSWTREGRSTGVRARLSGSIQQRSYSFEWGGPATLEMSGPGSRELALLTRTLLYLGGMPTDCGSVTRASAVPCSWLLPRRRACRIAKPKLSLHRHPTSLGEEAALILWDEALHPPSWFDDDAPEIFHRLNSVDLLPGYTDAFTLHEYGSNGSELAPPLDLRSPEGISAPVVMVDATVMHRSLGFRRSGDEMILRGGLICDPPGPPSWDSVAEEDDDWFEVTLPADAFATAYKAAFGPFDQLQRQLRR